MASSTLQIRTHRLLTQASVAVPDERDRLHHDVVRLNLPVAASIAGRYRDRGEPYDDLVQVGAIGLVKAVRAYDPDRGHPFLAYAVPVITGEVRRHFRDNVWTVRLPRPLQELRTALPAAQARVGHRLGRTPSVAELARDLGADEQTVREAIGADGCYRAYSLDVAAAADGDGGRLADLLAVHPDHGAAVDRRVQVWRAIRTLPADQRRVVGLRYVRDLTQDQIAREVGSSQMHVSRVLRRALGRLAEELADGDVSGAEVA